MMLLKLFRGTGPGVILLIILTLGALWTGAILEPEVRGASLYEIKPMPLYGIFRDLIGSHRGIAIIVTMVLVTLMLFLIVIFNTTVFFINERTFLPAVFYLLITAVFTRLQVFNPVLPASIFLMLALFRIMDSYRKAGNISNFFDAGILTGIGSMFYGNMLWLGILPVVGVLLLRPLTFREIMLSLLGIATPWLLLSGIYYILDYDLGILLTDIRDNLFGANTPDSLDNLTIAVLVWLGLMLLISIGFLVNQINSKKIKSRKAFNLLLGLFLLSVALFVIPGPVSIEIVWVVCIPASYLLTHYFIFARNKIISEITFSVFFLLILLVQILHIF